MKPAMIVCVLVTRAPGKGPKDMEFRVAVVQKSSLPPNESGGLQSSKLSGLRPIFEGNKGVRVASDYRSATPLINNMRGQGRLRLGEVFYNCGSLYFDGTTAPLIVESADQGDDKDISNRSKGSIVRMDRRRREGRLAPSSREME